MNPKTPAAIRSQYSVHEPCIENNRRRSSSPAQGHPFQFTQQALFPAINNCHACQCKDRKNTEQDGVRQITVWQNMQCGPSGQRQQHRMAYPADQPRTMWIEPLIMKPAKGKRIGASYCQCEQKTYQKHADKNHISLPWGLIPKQHERRISCCRNKPNNHSKR